MDRHRPPPLEPLPPVTAIMPKYYFSLQIPAAEYLRYYQGGATRVFVRSRDGRRLSIPAHNLRQFVTGSGIHGDFCLTVGDDNRLLSIERAPARSPRPCTGCGGGPSP